jgi:Ner family transcriptional regulator
LKKAPSLWDKHAILAEIGRRGSSLSRIAEERGMKRATLSWALKIPRVRANRAIAEFLGVPLRELWPQWFDSEGKLISREAIPRPEIKRIPQGSGPSRPRNRAA